ncbi:hypothetical protein OSB04_011538 [Centaurea solstitialis]|uniref:Uncharacterized protein n=1 Tax=Centaurea solstitialis TaxID=347529 RepID=A0AA38WP79_9ASTR|nr:hypothetical protein OSB04_011538 [Centaurea solstitialis]
MTGSKSVLSDYRDEKGPSVTIGGTGKGQTRGYDILTNGVTTWKLFSLVLESLSHGGAVAVYPSLASGVVFGIVKKGKRYVIEKPISRPKCNSPEKDFADYFKFMADESDVMSILYFSTSPEFTAI